MDMYSSGTSKKKMLVPLVVLLLCAVALVGAGYAITTTQTENGGSTITDDTFEVTLTNAAGSAEITAPWFTGAKVIDFGAVKTAASLAGESPYIAYYNAGLCQANLATGKIIVSQETGTITGHAANATVTVNLPAISADITKLVNIQFKVGDEVKATFASTAQSGTFTVPIGASGVAVSIVATLTDYVTAGTGNSNIANSVSLADYTAFNTAVASATLGFTFTAAIADA